VGKSTLGNELARRFLCEQPSGRVAILGTHPPASRSGGALAALGAAARDVQDDRVFFRSLVTGGSRTGLSASAPAAIDRLRRSQQFDLIIIECRPVSAGRDPFRRRARRAVPLADAVLFVTAPHHRASTELVTDPLLPGADLVALNHGDDPRGRSAKTELAVSLARHEPRPILFLTTATRRDDVGVSRLYAAVSELADWDGAGGERACQLRING
jgi:putative protein kinase ArgK-like GTPase of G3E family